jgi:hypothetical protein
MAANPIDAWDIRLGVMPLATDSAARRAAQAELREESGRRFRGALN